MKCEQKYSILIDTASEFSVFVVNPLLVRWNTEIGICDYAGIDWESFYFLENRFENALAYIKRTR